MNKYFFYFFADSSRIFVYIGVPSANEKKAHGTKAGAKATATHRPRSGAKAPNPRKPGASKRSGKAETPTAIVGSNFQRTRP